VDVHAVFYGFGGQVVKCPFNELGVVHYSFFNVL
jgi:hypothetical protein